MKIGDTKVENSPYDEFRELIRLGRQAIEKRLLGILIRPRALAEADKAELEDVKALLSRYDELMDQKYWYTLPQAANDDDWGTN